MRTKGTEFTSFSSYCEFDIIVIIETWLNSDFYNEEFFNTNIYNVYRKDRDPLSTGCYRGGGVLIAVKKCMFSKIVPLCDNNLLYDQICVAVKSSNGYLYICASYIPPNSSDELYVGHVENIVQFSNNMSYEDRLCVLGDFNLNGIVWSEMFNIGFCVPNNVNTASEINLIDSFFSIDLRQLNNVINKLGKILDLAFFSSDLKCSVSEYMFSVSPTNMHHTALEINVEFYDFLRDNCNIVSNYDYKSCNFNIIGYLINDIDWTTVLESDIVSICYDEFLKRLNAIFINNIKILKPRVYKLPWYTRGLKRLKNLRNKHYNNFQISNNANEEYLYLHYMREFNFLNKFLYNQYILGYGESIKSNPKRFWSFIQSKRNCSSIPSIMTYDNVASNSLEHSVNLFKDFFSSNFSSEHTTANEADFSEIISHVDMSTLQISDDDIYSGISKLSMSHKLDVDGFSSFLIKQCATSFIMPLKIIFTKSLNTGYFIQKWKNTVIVPVYKSGHKNNVTNYRAISKLSNISKLFEHIVYDKLFFSFKRYINPSQHGFFRGRSSTSNLAIFTRYCIDSFVNCHQVDTIYTDFSKAFDKVPHNILILKLGLFGVRPPLLNWFNSYLKNRICRVVVDGIASDSYSPNTGVPQGSILGPLLFNIFINDIAHCFIHSKHLLYADDLKIFKAVSSINDTLLIQEDINRFVAWSSVNGLPINFDKCYHLKYHRCRDRIISKYTMLDNRLETVTEFLDLGIVFDTKLTFIPHLNYIIPKTFSTLYFIRRNTAQFTDPYIKKIIYSSFVRSKLEYASFIWSPTANIHINRIEKIQKSFLKFALNFLNFGFPLPSYESRCLLISLKSLKSRRDIASLIFLNDIIIGNIDSSELLSLIHINAPSRSLRHYHPFYIDNYVSNYALNEPITKSMRLFNSLCSLLDLSFSKNKMKTVLYRIIN